MVSCQLHMLLHQPPRYVAGVEPVRLELVDKGGNVVDNSGFNATERTITVVR